MGGVGQEILCVILRGVHISISKIATEHLSDKCFTSLSHRTVVCCPKHDSVLLKMQCPGEGQNKTICAHCLQHSLSSFSDSESG